MLEKETYIGDNLIAAARFFSKKAFLSVGGYNEKMVAYEEHDLHNRILNNGFKIVRVPKVEEINIGEPISILEIAKKHYYGKTIGKFVKKNPERAKRQIAPLRSSYIRHWKNFLVHPKLTTGFIIYQFVRYLSAGLGYISIINTCKVKCNKSAMIGLINCVMTIMLFYKVNQSLNGDFIIFVLQPLMMVIR